MTSGTSAIMVHEKDINYYISWDGMVLVYFIRVKELLFNILGFHKT